MLHGRFHPVTMCKLQGGLDAQGNLVGLHMRISGQSIVAGIFPQNIRDGRDPVAFQGLNASGGEADIGYTIPNLLIDHAMRNPHVPPGFWRGVNLNQNAIYLECFMDELAHAAGVRMHIETHRNRMTTDLFFMLHLLDAMPNLRLTGDLSHYVVGREFWYPISDEDDAMMQRIINNCWGFHGRVASREQIQLQISFPQNQHWVEVFMDWWRRGFVQWRQKANQDDTLTFLCELGPPEYAMTGADGYELSDRWQESLTMKDQIRDLWQSVTQQ